MNTAIKIALFLIAHRDEVAALEAQGEEIFGVIQKLVAAVAAAKAAGQ